MNDAPINLNKRRKERAKLVRRQQADENAVRFGRSKAEKAADKIEVDKTVRHLDGHRRDT